MKICDHVTEKCFEPSATHKEPCFHATEHPEREDCLGGRCDRHADWGDGQMPRPLNPIYVKHVEA